MGLWDRNFVTDTIRYSRSWFAILGYYNVSASNTMEIAYGRVHPDDLAHVQRNIQMHYEGQTKTYEVEHRLRCKNGTYKWVLSRGKIIGYTDDGKASRMVGTTTDITTIRTLTETLKLRFAEAQTHSAEMMTLAKNLAEREQELAAAHKLAGVGSWQWDLVNRHLLFSTETWAIMGRKPSLEAVSYEQMREMYQPDDYISSMAIYRDIVTSGVPARLEYRFVRPDGSIRIALSHVAPVVGLDGSISIVRGTTQDITSYREIEMALRESEDHYRHMVNLHPQIPWTAGPDGGILEIGPQWHRITGMTAEETKPFGWFTAVHSEDQPRVIAAWHARIVTGESVDIEYRVKSLTGDFIWLRARAAARFDQNNKIYRWYGTLENVTDRRIAEQARRASDELAFRVLEMTSDAVIVCDINGNITFANAKATAQIGGNSSLVGQQVHGIFCERHGQSILQAINHAVNSKQNTCLEMFWPVINCWFEVHIFAASVDISLFMRDITEKRLSQQKLDYAATHDLLTRTLNRETFFTILTDEYTKKNCNNFLALFCLDLDYFKDFNDTHGHPAGDALLTKVAYRIQGCLRTNDLLARSGGDEFLILQRNMSSATDANALAEKIIEKMRVPFVINEHSFVINLSIGIAISLPDQTDPDLLYNRADLALYEAKDKARGGFRMFRPILQILSDEMRHIRNDLTSAIHKNQFYLVYQPIMRISDMKVVGVEALIRWQHPNYGLIPPSQFISIAEKNGFISDIGSWVLERACADAMSWPSNINLSVNISPRQFALSDVQAVVINALSTTRLPASRLKLEITESLPLSSNTNNLKILEALRDLGLTIVLDDFGTGYSSLSYLETFKFDIIKVDQLFLSKIKTTDDHQPILEAIIALAKALVLPITVEGVETDIQLDYLRRLGCEYAQGYLFSKPMPKHDLQKLFAREFCDTFNIIKGA